MLHHNFLFLKFFAEEIEDKILATNIQACYANGANELVLDFGPNGHLKATFIQGICFYTFIDSTLIIGKNFKPRFRELWGRKVQRIKLFGYERAFSFELSGSSSFVFLLFGRRSNILHYPQIDSLPKEAFRFEMKADLNKTLEQQLHSFFEKQAASEPFLSNLFIAPEFKNWCVANSIHSEIEFEKRLNSLPPYFKLQENHEFVIGNAAEASDFLSQLKQYYIYHVSTFAFNSRKDSLLKELKTSLQKKEHSLRKLENRLEQLQSERPYSEIADLILSNLHAYTPSNPLIVEDFYQENTPLTIIIPEKLSPVEYATKLYKKQSGRQEEQQRLLNEKEQTESQILELFEKIEKVEACKFMSELERFEKSKNKEQQSDTLPYHKVEFKGIEIRIGKSAEKNDDLLRLHSHKNDLWLHAKGTSGSHVLIRTNSKPVSGEVKEMAASFAAWFSKYRNRQTAEVSITERKYVRKAKGLKPGQVFVEREEVLLVSPQKPE